MDALLHPALQPARVAFLLAILCILLMATSAKAEQFDIASLNPIAVTDARPCNQNVCFVGTSRGKTYVFVVSYAEEVLEIYLVAGTPEEPVFQLLWAKEAI